MPKLNILKKNWEFQEILKTKKQIVSKEVILYYKKNNGPLLIGISIPKKFVIAAKRNYLKRQVKSILQKQNLDDIKFRIVLIIRKSFIDLNFYEKQEAILKSIERLKKAK